MRLAARIFIVLIALAEVAGWTYFTLSLLNLRNAFGGSGDGIGSPTDFLGEMVVTLLMVAIWIFLVSPYIIMTACSLNFIKGKARRKPYIYSLVILSLFTVSLVAFLITEILFAPSLQWSLVAMTTGNIIMFVLWLYPGIKAEKTETK